MNPHRLRFVILVFALGAVLCGSAYLFGRQPAPRQPKDVSLASVPAVAETVHSAYLPLTFPAEAQHIRTTACLQVKEVIHPQTAWWQEVGGNIRAADSAFKSVISAIVRKDRGALSELSDPKQRRDPKRFDEQADAFFQQFEVLKIVAVPRSYEFDGLAVFFVKLQSTGKVFFAPFPFVRESDSSFRFLPYRTEETSYQLVAQWFDEAWGPSATDKPAYCSDEDIKRATHRVALVPSPGTQPWQPSSLFLLGALSDAPGELASLIGQTKRTLEEMQVALAKNRIDEFIQHLTPEGGNRLKDWWGSASEAERNNYKVAITQQKLFFVFDASPLIVAYTRSSASTVQVMYFTFRAGNRLLWTNSSHVTIADKVFKQGLLYRAATQDRPFSSLTIK